MKFEANAFAEVKKSVCIITALSQSARLRLGTGCANR